MASKPVETLLESLRNDRTDVVLYRTPTLRALDMERAELLEDKAHGERHGTLTDEEKAALEARLAGLDEEIRSREESTPSHVIPFRFVKPRAHERSAAEEFYRKEFDTRLNLLIKRDGEGRKRSVRLSVENEILLATDDVEEAERRAKGVLVETLLELEGRSEEWVHMIDDADPEMQLTEEQEKELALTPDLSPEEFNRRVAVRADILEDIKRVKRGNIEEMRELERKERREAMMAMKTDELVANLVMREFHEEASRYAAQRIQDFLIQMAARNPDETETTLRGDARITVQKHHFATVDELTRLRESENEIENDLYDWMSETYANLQLVRGPGDIRRVAESAGFPSPL